MSKKRESSQKHQLQMEIEQKKPEINSITIQQPHEDHNNSRLTLSDNMSEQQNTQTKQNKKQQKKQYKKQKISQKKQGFADKKLSEVLRKKQQLQEQLKRVAYQESRLKQKKSRISQKSQQRKNRYFRSTITEDEKSKIKQIIKDTEKTQKKISEKNQILMAKLQKTYEKQRQERQRRQRELSQKKRRQIQHKMEQLRHRKQQRQQHLRRTDQQFSKVKKKKFLHQIIDEKWKIIQQAEEQENQKIKQAKAREKHYNNQQIIAHQRKYSQILKQNKRKRQTNMLKFHQNLQQYEKAVTKYPSSVFFKTITQEQAHKQKTKQDKMMSSQIFMTKRSLYAQTVREKFKSSLAKSPASRKKQSQQDQKQLSRYKRVQSLDYIGIQKLGNDYMKQVNSCIGQQAISKSKLALQKQNPEVFKYPDYLTEARSKRHIQNKSEQQHEKQLKQIKKIIKAKKKSNDGNKSKTDDDFKKAKLLAQRLDEKALQKKGDYRILVDSIAAKISILEEFSH